MENKASIWWEDLRQLTEYNSLAQIYGMYGNDT